MSSRLKIKVYFVVDKYRGLYIAHDLFLKKGNYGRSKFENTSEWATSKLSENHKIVKFGSPELSIGSPELSIGSPELSI